MKNFLFFIICLMLPIFVMADSGVDYEEAIHYTNNYIYSFDKYNSYLFFKDKLEYVYEDGVFSYSPNFKSGGLLSKTEYEISNRDGKTFLSNGLEYWTLSKSSGGRHFVLNYRLQEKDDTLNSGVRVTEYVKTNSVVSGTGSYADPWKFSEVLNMHLNSTNIIRGKVSTVPCSDTSMQKEIITLSFTSGSSVDAYICPANGYTVFTNSCSGYMTKDLDNRYVVSGVSKDNLICNIKFTYLTNTVTLGCNNCNIAPSPSTIYSNEVHDLWFNNKNGLDENKIKKLSIVPHKIGYTFKGYYKDGMLIIDENGNLMNDSTSAIKSNTTIDALFEPNQYNLSLDIESPTSSDHTKSISVIFDSRLDDIIIPKRVYTVNYNGNGGTVARTQDIVKYNFDGYFYDGVQYYNSVGKSTGIWNIAEDVTLIGKWSGGKVSLPTATRPGYKLVGWYDANGNKVENGSQVTKNLNLTAKWEAIEVNYKVKHYKENLDGSFATPEIETFTAKTATKVTPSIKTYTGFESPKSQEAEVDGNGTTVIEYRYLRKKYEVKIGVNDDSYGTVNSSSLTIKHGITYSVSGNVLTFSDGQKVTATETSKTGYTTKFSSWSSSSGTITKTTTITANFSRSPIKYTYTFTSANSSYGSVSPTSLSVPYDSTYSVSGNVLTFSDGQTVTATATAKTGYTTKFGSWSSTSGTVKGTASISASFTRTANKYSIIYNCNGGIPTKAYSSDHTYDLSANLITNECTRSGFSHQGWNTAANGSGKNYSNEEIVLNLKSANNDTINLYAKWKDTESPSCKLKATTNGVLFESKTDNVGVTAFGLIKSKTATYNEKSTLELSDGTFYGYVKDAAGNTGKCSITIGKTYISSYSKTTKKCDRTKEDYDKTTQTCNRSVADYTKTTKKCNSYVSNYTKTSKVCQRTFKEYIKSSSICDRSVSSYTISKKRCGTKSTTYSGTCCCRNTMYSACEYKSALEQTSNSCSTVCEGLGYGWGQGTLKADKTSYVWSNTTTLIKQPSCDASVISCDSSTVGKWYVTCTPDYTYSLGETISSISPQCAPKTISCLSSTYGDYNVTCTPNYIYSFDSLNTETVPNCSPNTFSCTSETYNQTYVTCSTNYGYSFGKDSSEVVSSCSSNDISCNSSTVGQTHVACSKNYDYAFDSSTTNASSCSKGKAFTCDSSTFGQTYVSDCSTNYSYLFKPLDTSVTSCSIEDSFTCNSSNYGKSYVSNCSPESYACNDSGYTKINNSYCYKY